MIQMSIIQMSMIQMSMIQMSMIQMNINNADSSAGRYLVLLGLHLVGGGQRHDERLPVLGQAALHGGGAR